MSEPIGAVLFDLDGTLADTALDLAYALNEQRRRHGLEPLPHEMIRPQASHGTRGLLRVGFDVGSKSPNFEALRIEFLELYTQHICDRTVLFPGTAELLDELEARKLRWGVVTNKPARLPYPYSKPCTWSIALPASSAATPRPIPNRIPNLCSLLPHKYASRPLLASMSAMPSAMWSQRSPPA